MIIIKTRQKTKNMVLPNGMLDKDKINHSLRQCSEAITYT